MNTNLHEKEKGRTAMKALSGWIGALVAAVMTVVMFALAGAPRRARRAGMLELAMLALVLVGVMAWTAPAAHAGYEAIYQTIAIDSGTSFTTADVPMAGSMIKEVVLDVPTLDSGDTSTFTLRSILGSKTYTPSGWSDKAIGATDDGALVKANASLLSTPVDGAVQIGFYCSTNQAAARTIGVWIIREY
jgi:hypothetical protein